MSRYRIFLLIALAYFLWRVPLRWIHHPNGFNDFSSSYINGRAWLHGDNPYTVDSFHQMWKEGGGVFEFARISMLTSGSLPSAVPFSASVAWLSWRQVSTLFLVLSLVAFMLMIGALYRLYGLSTCALAAFCLSLTPFHSGLNGQNAASILIPLMIISLWLVEKGHDVSAGVLLGVGTCYKPQLVLILVAFFLVKKRWKLCITSFSVVGAALGVFFALAQSGSAAAFLQRLSRFGIATPDDFGLANRARYELINLQLIPASFGLSRLACNAIAWSICVVLCLYWYFRTDRNIEPIVLIGLLPFYHRFYDAGLLVLPIAFALKHRPQLAWLALPFFVPLPLALYDRFGDRGPLWDSFVLCHQVWLLLAFSIGLLLWTRKAAQRDVTAQTAAVSSSFL